MDANGGKQGCDKTCDTVKLDKDMMAVGKEKIKRRFKGRQPKASVA